MLFPSLPQLARSRFCLVLPFLLLLGGSAPPVALAKTSQFTGSVVAVTDGDTIDVLVNKKARRVRLYGVDSPEKKQDFGMKAKQFTSSLAFGRIVTVDVKSRDRYGRTVGVVHLPDGRILNHELVRTGHAWWYESYAPRDTELKELEEEARREKLALWSRPDAVAPWIFRKNRRR